MKWSVFWQPRYPFARAPAQSWGSFVQTASQTYLKTWTYMYTYLNIITMTVSRLFTFTLCDKRGYKHVRVHRLWACLQDIVCDARHKVPNFNSTCTCLIRLLKDCMLSLHIYLTRHEESNQREIRSGKGNQWGSQMKVNTNGIRSWSWDLIHSLGRTWSGFRSCVHDQLV